MGRYLGASRIVVASLACFIAGGILAGTLALAPPGTVAWAPDLLLVSLLNEGVVSPPGPVHAAVPADSGRTTVLVLGMDRRPVESTEALSRADSLLLLTVDRSNHSASVLSIPRDLWVPIPVTDGRVIHDRINNAYLLGEQTGYPGGGAGLARATVEYNLGVRVHRYVVLDFEAFERAIDAIGGVEVNLPTALVDPAFPTADYGAMQVRIPAGQQHLNGQQALWFARSRYQSSDFSRMARQQQLMLAVRERLLRLDMIFRWPQLLAEQGTLINTDLGLSEAIDLARAGLGIPKDRITAQSLELGYVYRGAVPGDPFVLFPDRPRIRQLVAQLFPETSAPGSP